LLSGRYPSLFRNVARPAAGLRLLGQIRRFVIQNVIVKRLAIALEVEPLHRLRRSKAAAPAKGDDAVPSEAA
jgi:hypothetical protein